MKRFVVKNTIFNVSFLAFNKTQYIVKVQQVKSALISQSFAPEEQEKAESARERLAKVWVDIYTDLNQRLTRSLQYLTSNDID